MAAVITGVHLPMFFAADSPTPDLERDILLVAAVLALMAFPGAIESQSQPSPTHPPPNAAFSKLYPIEPALPNAVAVAG